MPVTVDDKVYKSKALALKVYSMPVDTCLLYTSKESVFSKIARAVAGKSKVDDEVLDNLEEVLITSDVGVETVSYTHLDVYKRQAYSC